MRLLLFLVAPLAYAQTADPGPDISVRANVAFQLDGTASSCSGGCLYAWRQTSGTKLLMSGSTTATPTVYGASETQSGGQLTFELIVKAISGGAVSAPVAVNVGVVPTDSQRIVAMPSGIRTVLGDIIQWGQSPWPYMDTSQAQQSTKYGARILPGVLLAANTGAYYPTWKSTAGRSGSVAMSNGSAAVSGTETLFQSVFISTLTSTVSTNGTTVTRLSGDPFSGTMSGSGDYGATNTRVVINGTPYTIVGVDTSSAPQTLTLSTSAGVQASVTSVWNRGGLVNTVGTAVTRVSGDFFSASMAGKAMIINGVTYTVLTVTDTSTIVLTGSAGTTSNQVWTAVWVCAPEDQNKIVFPYTESGILRWRGAGVGVVGTPYSSTGGCSSNTSLATDLSASDTTVATGTDGNWWMVRQSEYFRWASQGSTWNYYDGGLAHYALCFGAGLDEYCAYARQGVDLWVDNPAWDLGRGTGASALGPARNIALGGMMVRALEREAAGDDTVWDKITPFIAANNATVAVAPTVKITDVREKGYEELWAAWCAQVHPTIAADCTAALVTGNTRWLAQQQADGNWIDYQPGQFSGNATVTTGSSAVTSAGIFAAYMCNLPQRMWFAVDLDDGDALTYKCIFNNSSSITLTDEDGVTPKNYQATGCGAPNCTKQFQAAAADGRGSIGFMEGIAGLAMGQTARALSSAPAQAATDALVNYLGVDSYAYKAAEEGIYFCRVYPSASTDGLPGGPVTYGCDNQGDGNNANRNYQTEIVRAHGLATLTAAVSARADRMLGNCYTQGGGPSTTDGYNNCQELILIDNIKFLGFISGMGGSRNWAAVRLGGYAGANVVARDITASFDGTTSVEVKTGAASTPTTTACPASPCSINFDATTGGAYRILRGGVTGNWISLAGS